MNKNFKSILKGAGVAFVGAGLTALFTYFYGLDYMFTIQGEEMDLTVVAVAALSVAVNVIRKMAPGLLGVIRK